MVVGVDGIVVVVDPPGTVVVVDDDVVGSVVVVVDSEVDGVGDGVAPAGDTIAVETSPATRSTPIPSTARRARPGRSRPLAGARRLVSGAGMT
jgi:hypothetical protein